MTKNTNHGEVDSPPPQTSPAKRIALWILPRAEEKIREEKKNLVDMARRIRNRLMTLLPDDDSRMIAKLDWEEEFRCETSLVKSPEILSGDPDIYCVPDCSSSSSDTQDGGRE